MIGSYSHNETAKGPSADDIADGYTTTTAVMIIALCSASVFLLMVVVIFIVNEKNSKQINKVMVVSLYLCIKMQIQTGVLDWWRSSF